MTPYKKYTPQHVANFILKKEEQLGRTITQLKLLKLVYLVYGWALAVLNRKLFDEPIEVWKFGPVIRSLYNEFKRFGSDPIIGYSVEINEDTQEIEKPFIPEHEQDLLLVMEKAWETYSPFTASALVSKTHEPDSPWAKCDPHTNIPDELITKYFLKKIEQYLNE